MLVHPLHKQDGLRVDTISFVFRKPKGVMRKLTGLVQVTAQFTPTDAPEIFK